MQILSEREMEDILVIHPELIESGLTLIDRQAQLESRRTDLTFKDKNDRILLVELKKDQVTDENVQQLMDYIIRFKRTGIRNVRGMIIGQSVPKSIRFLCKTENLEYKAIPVKRLFEFLQQNDTGLYHDIFIKGKLHTQAKKAEKLQFQEYLDATSPYQTPYTTYQHFRAQDASSGLSENNKLNQSVADEFMNRISDLNFERDIFKGNAVLKRVNDSAPKQVSLAGDGSWQGINLQYMLQSDDYPKGLDCELYLGTIGYRGNKPTFADERSRFLVIRVGPQRKEGSTQYGLHKYLQTEKRALAPFYELKFNAQSLPKVVWPRMYDTFEHFGYQLSDAGTNSTLKQLYIGEISLDDKKSIHQIGNLIEALFVVGITKEHFKRKGPSFQFLITS